jgi:hypothetical protein
MIELVLWLGSTAATTSTILLWAFFLHIMRGSTCWSTSPLTAPHDQEGVRGSSASPSGLALRCQSRSNSKWLRHRPFIYSTPFLPLWMLCAIPNMAFIRSEGYVRLALVYQDTSSNQLLCSLSFSVVFRRCPVYLFSRRASKAARYWARVSYRDVTTEFSCISASRNPLTSSSSDTRCVLHSK